MDDEHPIRVVARRTGLTPHVIRVWEKRYSAVTPKRSNTNRRFYTNADVDRLRLLRRATQTGRSIGQIAKLPTERLEVMVHLDEKAIRQTLRGSNLAATEFKPAKYLKDCLTAVEQMNAKEFDASLVLASLHLSQSVLLEQLIEPLMIQIGDLWESGKLTAAHEHFASAGVRNLLGSMSKRPESQIDLPLILVTTPAGQHHEFGALIAAITAAENGWRVSYLGPNLPADDIVQAVDRTNARAIALSITYASDEMQTSMELQKLQRLPANVTVIAGGRAVESQRSALQSINSVIVFDLATLRSELEALRLANDE